MKKMADHSVLCFISNWTRHWFISLPLCCYLFLSSFLASLAFIFRHVRMTDGSQQNRVSGIIPRTNGCGLLGQALDRTEINILPFKVYQRRIFLRVLQLPAFSYIGQAVLPLPLRTPNTESDTLQLQAVINKPAPSQILTAVASEQWWMVRKAAIHFVRPLRRWILSTSSCRPSFFTLHKKHKWVGIEKRQRRRSAADKEELYMRNMGKDWEGNA